MSGGKRTDNDEGRADNGKDPVESASRNFKRFKVMKSARIILLSPGEALFYPPTPAVNV